MFKILLLLVTNKDTSPLCQFRVQDVVKDFGAKTVLYWEIWESCPVYTVIPARSHHTGAFPILKREKEDISTTEILTGILGNLGLQILKPEPQNFSSF